MSNSKQQEIFSELTEKRINRLPDEVVEVMLAGAKEELASISDDARFAEKKIFALMAVMLSIMGFSGQFMQTLYQQNILGFGVVVILGLSALYFAVRSAYATKYYGAFFDVHDTLEALEYYSEQQRRVRDKSGFSSLLLLWYADSIAHNARVVNAKSVYFNRALISLTAAVIIAVIMFIAIDINMAKDAMP